MMIAMLRFPDIKPRHLLLGHDCHKSAIKPESILVACTNCTALAVYDRADDNASEEGGAKFISRNACDYCDAKMGKA